MKEWMDKVMEPLIFKNRLLSFISGFLVVGGATAVVFFILISPTLLFEDVQIVELLKGSVGVWIGAGVVNGFIISMMD